MSNSSKERKTIQNSNSNFIWKSLNLIQIDPIGNISVPGTIGATVVEEPVSVDDGFDPNSPLVYNFGHKSPGVNMPLMNQYVTHMADAIRDQFKGALDRQ